MSSYKNPVKPGTFVLQSTRILDQLRERIRYMHYSLSTEQVYVYWVRFFIRWSGHGGAMRHPRDMGASDVEAFFDASRHRPQGVCFHAQPSLERDFVSLSGSSRY